MNYDFDIDIVVPNLTPEVKRLPKYLAWLKSLTTPIQTAWLYLFNDYKTGSLYSDYSNVTAYVVGDVVIFTDNKVYECILATTGNDCLNATYWTLVNENFIGADERITYNSQIIILERALNKWFRNLLATDQIYIATNQISTTIFMMGNSGIYSSKMASDSTYSLTYMGEAPTFSTQYNFTVNVPVALFTTLGSNPTNRENAVRNFVDKYVLAGINYNVTTF